MKTSELVIEAPGVRDLVERAVALYRAVRAGRWSAAIEATADRWADVEAAKHAYDEIAADGEPVVGNADLGTIGGEGPDSIIWQGPASEVREALNLWMRTQMGQFGEVAWTAGRDHSVSERLLALRVEYANAGTWPAQRHASWGIGSEKLGPSVRVAYDIWKLLGGGVSDRPLLTGKATVRATDSSG